MKTSISDASCEMVVDACNELTSDEPEFVACTIWLSSSTVTVPRFINETDIIARNWPVSQRTPR
jgi:hypothetical protein